MGSWFCMLVMRRTFFPLLLMLAASSRGVISIHVCPVTSSESSPLFMKNTDRFLIPVNKINEESVSLKVSLPRCKFSDTIEIVPYYIWEMRLDLTTVKDNNDKEWYQLQFRVKHGKFNLEVTGLPEPYIYQGTKSIPVTCLNLPGYFVTSSVDKLSIFCDDNLSLSDHWKNVLGGDTWNDPDLSSLDFDQDDLSSSDRNKDIPHISSWDYDEIDDLSKNDAFENNLDLKKTLDDLYNNNNENLDDFYKNSNNNYHSSFRGGHIIFIPVGAIIFLLSVCLRCCLCRRRKVVQCVRTITVVRQVPVSSGDNIVTNEPSSPDPTDLPPAYTDVEQPPPSYSELEKLSSFSPVVSKPNDPVDSAAAPTETGGVRQTSEGALETPMASHSESTPLDAASGLRNNVEEETTPTSARGFSVRSLKSQFAFKPMKEEE